MARPSTVVLDGALLLGVLAAACAPGADGDRRVAGPPPVPVITSLSVAEASVGDRIQFFGEGFVDAEAGWTDVHFVGEFVPDDGSAANQVDLTVPLQRGVDGALSWESFGGYRVPFLPTGNKLGAFHGEIYAENNFYRGTPHFPEEEGSILQAAAHLQSTFHVLPSIVVLDNRAFGDTFVADCKEPATVLLEMMRYAFRVKALGFEPARFEFVLGPGLLQADPTLREWLIREGTTEVAAAAGGRDEFAIVHRWSPTPLESYAYESYVTAQAAGIGVSKSVTFPFTVRPWAYPAFEGRQAVVAELMRPQPVSSCIPGGPNSFQTQYTETESETRQRSIAAALKRNFTEVLSQAHEQSYDFSQTDTFMQTQSSQVTMGDTSTQEMSTSSTDLFSASAAKRRADQLGWKAEIGQMDSTIIADEGIQDAKVTMLGIPSATNNLGRAIRNAEEVQAAPLATSGLWGHRYLRNNYITDSADSADTGSVLSTATTEGTRGQNLQEGRTWGFTRSYREQLGFSEERSRANRQSFGEAVIASREIRSALGTTENEVITQSSSESVSRDTTGWVWAGKQGTWYRQAVRVVVPGVMVALDYCGNGTAVGEIQLSEWLWGIDLAYGDTCPPRTNFLPAECRLEPCTGGQ